MRLIRSPAKVNLALKILGRRSDGYHDLDSLVAPISLFDEIEIQSASRDEVSYTQQGKPLIFEDDLIARTIQRIRSDNDLQHHFSIKTTKSIPIGGGLGGGSSNAATVLKYVKEKYISDLDTYRLATHLGSDVSFFLSGQAAQISGAGEVVEPVKLEKLDLLVVWPGFPVNTRQAYDWYDSQTELTQDAANATPKRLVQVAEGRPTEITLQEVVKNLHNDLEKSVEARHPEIATVKEALRKWGALGSLMSGSGSSVFGIFRSLDDANAAKQRLQPTFPSNYLFFTCQTL